MRGDPLTKILGLWYIYAANLRHTVVASLPQTHFSYANYFSGALFAANLWHTVVAYIVEGADRVRGRGEKKGREEGEEGAGGGRRGGGRREKSGREEG